MLFIAFFLCLGPVVSSLVPTRQASSKEDARRFQWIQKFASIGDSYAAGLGAGSRIDWGCSRYDKSYPHLLQSSLLGDNPHRKHQFLACSGAATPQILESQIPFLERDLDLLTISAGGNDIGITPIISDCIYQFFKGGSKDCESAIKEAREKIAAKDRLYRNVTRVLDAVKPNMNEDRGLIYVTGYAGFFGAEDGLCDNVTWSVWKDIECDEKKEYLTLKLRKALNELVVEVNDVLREVVEAAGTNVRFIDYDYLIEKNRGRYCEPGIQEPDPNRVELDFYEWATVDSGENRTEMNNRTGDDVPKGSFEGDIGERINKTLQEHPDWEFDPDMGFVNKSKIREEDWLGDTIHWLLPDAWKRVFHLRPRGHALIAKLLLEDLALRGPGSAEIEEEEQWDL
ncbi:SGNH hydrolase [Lojkania enalia]|uniref:SGNH hydrolase n=1 Tax=Lojkania enalia TaxID=147567 RepID=A0A9P4K8Q7_9PLEO|nr:SGNH hydrolase [Didymosphaeria enalia]